MRKLLISLLCVIMVVCFMPTMAFAEDVSEPIASVNGVNCTTIEEVVGKVTEATEKVKIVLLADVELPTTLNVEEGKDIELDLNGRSITVGWKTENERHYYAIDNYGTLLIKDGSDNKSGSITARGIENLGNGKMTIDSGIFTAQDTNGGAAIWNEGELEINGGTFKTTHVGSPGDTYGPGCLNNMGSALITGGSFEGANRRTYAIISTGEITITPAEGKTVTVNGAHGGIGVDSGKAIINGGTYSSTDYYGLYVSNDGVGTDPRQAVVTVNGGEFSGPNYSVWIGSDYNNPVNSTIEINGGNFNQPIKEQEDVTRENAIVVKGGTFASDVTQHLPKTGCYNVAKTDEAETWTVTTDHKWNDGETTIEPTYNATGVKTYTCLVEGCGETKTEVIPKKERPYVPPAPTDNVTNQPGTQGTGTTEATAPTTTANMSNSTTVKTETKVDAATGETKNVVTSQTTVDNATAEKIVDKAVANKSEEVVIDTTTSTPANTEAAQVGIPTATLEAISEKTEADVTVKTDVAEVTMDNKTAGEIAEQATGATVQIVAEKTKENANKVEFELKVVDSNGKVISDFNGGNVSVTVKVPVVMKDKKIVCVYIDDNGKVSKVKGQKNDNDTFTFITNHFSTYAIMTEEEADAAIGAQVEELVKGLKDIDLVARSVRTSKGNVKVTLKVDKEGKAIIDELKEAGYTVKYNFYRSTKKRAGYVSKMINVKTTYTNTYGKKGTMYFYKARVQVYDAEGKLIARTALKDCKYASRLWKK